MKKKPLIALTSILTVTIAFAAILYTLTIPNNMKLTASYSLALKRTTGAIITSYTWPDFEEDETKIMHEADGYVELWNTGNTHVNVTWTSNCPSEWQVTIEATYTVTFNPWTTGTIKELGTTTLNPLKLKIYLTELTATAGTDYSFDLNFNVE